MLRRAKAKYRSSKRNTATDADILGMYCVCVLRIVRSLQEGGRQGRERGGMRESICICIYEIKHKVRSGDRRLLHIWHT